MRPLRQIRRNKKVRLGDATVNGGYGEIQTEGFRAFVVWGSDEDGWEHVSISPFSVDYIPSWEEMCMVKDIFWREEEAVLQIHPPKQKYVNIMKKLPAPVETEKWDPWDEPGMG